LRAFFAEGLFTFSGAPSLLVPDGVEEFEEGVGQGAEVIGVGFPLEIDKDESDGRDSCCCDEKSEDDGVPIRFCPEFSAEFPLSPTFLLKVEFHLFFIAFAGRPCSIFAISTHLLPRVSCALIINSSSCEVQASLRTSGARWL